MNNNYRAFFFGPRLSSSNFKTSERRTNTRPPTVTVFSRSRLINSLIDALETFRRRAASACEIKSSVASIFLFFSMVYYLDIVRVMSHNPNQNYLNNVKGNQAREGTAKWPDK